MRFSKSVRIPPADDSSCGWSATLPAPPPARRLLGAERADCAVIGAGFTGLAIARRLAQVRPEWRVVILEAQRVGSGASGRASGFVVDLTDFVAKMPPAARDMYVEVARSGIEELRRLVREHAIDCGWDETGWVRAAGGEVGVGLLESVLSLLDGMDVAYVRLDRAGMRQVTGSDFYAAGARLPGYPLVHSAVLVRGLAAALPASAELYEESPVRAIEADRGFRLTAGEGSIVAERLFLATNGYTPGLGFLESRIFPLYAFGSLTRPLTADEQEILGGEREWGLLAMDPMGSSVRRTRDQRILIRNTNYYHWRLKVSDATRRRMRRYHRQAFEARFPMLSGMELEYTWPGLMGTAWNGQISFGELRPNFYVAAAYTAAGIAMGTASGRLIANLAAGVESEQLRFVLDLPKSTWMPPEPFRSLGGWWLNERMNARAGVYL